MSSPLSFQCVKPTKVSWTGTLTFDGKTVSTQKDSVLPAGHPLVQLALAHGCVGSSLKTDTTITHMGKQMVINGTLTAL